MISEQGVVIVTPRMRNSLALVSGCTKFLVINTPYGTVLRKKPLHRYNWLNASIGWFIAQFFVSKNDKLYRTWGVSTRSWHQCLCHLMMWFFIFKVCPQNYSYVYTDQLIIYVHLHPRLSWINNQWCCPFGWSCVPEISIGYYAKYKGSIILFWRWWFLWQKELMP